MLKWICWGGVLSFLLLSSTSCANFHSFVQDLNASGISNCLFIQGTFPPYGNAYLYAKAGEIDCERIWQNRLRLEGP